VLLFLAGGLGCTKAKFALDPIVDAGEDIGEDVGEDISDEIGQEGDSMSEVPDVGPIADERDADAPDDQAPADGTNTPMPTQLGQIVVTELMNDPNVVADAYGEWFEIYNPSDSVTFDLNGCDITDAAVGRHTIARSLSVPPKCLRTLAIHEKRTPTSPFGVPFDPDYVYSAVRFGNTHADGVHVICAGITIATFDYPPPDVSMSSHSFSVDPAHYAEGDNQVPGHWCAAADVYDADPQMIVRDYGTPGRTNPPCK